MAGWQRFVVGASLLVLAVTLWTSLINMWPAVSKLTADTAVVQSAGAKDSADAATTAAATAAASAQSAGAGVGIQDAAKAIADTADATAKAAQATAQAAKQAAASTESVASQPDAGISLFFGLYKPDVKADAALLLLVLLAGLLGSLVHVASSFALHSSRGDLTVSYLWWYPMRFVVGAGLAMLLYVALRGGLLNGDLNAKDVNPYGIAAAAGLSGMFSKQAADKLAQIFDVAFSMAPAKGAPKIDKLDPSKVPAGSPDTTVKVTGGEFVDGITATANDVAVEARLVNGGEVSVVVPASMLASEGVVKIRVENPDTTTGASAPADLTVVPAPGASVAGAHEPGAEHGPTAEHGPATAADPKAPGAVDRPPSPASSSPAPSSPPSPSPPSLSADTI